jgi:hypothetical protein
MPQLQPIRQLQREGYIANVRVRAASIVTRLSAVLLFLGFVGSLLTWGKHKSIFELASSPSETARPGLGYVLGPALIMLLVPLVRRLPTARIGENPWFAYSRRYRTRVVIAAVLFVAGLVILAVNLAQLKADFTFRAGSYIAAALLLVGLGATLAMWPSDLATMDVGQAGPARTAPPVRGDGSQPPPPEEPAKPLPPAGWYRNPEGPGRRYWDGAHWTNQYG